MKEINSEKKYGLIVLLLLVVLAITTAATAFFMDSHTKVNTFKIGSNESEIKEVFTPPDKVSAGDQVEKEVAVKNLNMKSYVRMYVAISDSDLAKKFSINFNTSDWKLDQDGYYYYNKVVAKGETTTPIFDTLTFKASLPEDADLEIICYAETVQAEGFSSAKAAFAAIS